VSKLSSTNESIETIWSQLTTQQQENKKLMDLTQKLQERMQKRNRKKQTAMGDQDKQWKDHLDKETATWTDRLGQVKQNLEMTTNQTIKMYKTMNDCL
jgi:coenzyme F420-reducing hydrogenase alpha subunit